MRTLRNIESILVLCEGNHCRSPIAEGLLRATLGPEIRVESAGLKAIEGHPAHPEVLRLMAERGIDLSAHRSRQLTPSMALSANLILVMDQQQKDWCNQMAPSTRGRVFLLGQWLPSAPRDIADPLFQNPEAFRLALDIIQRSIEGWLPRIARNQKRSA